MVASVLNQFAALFSSPIFLSAFSAWFIAQFIKALIEVVRYKKQDTRSLLVTLLWTTGGMPSSHSSVVSALVAALGYELGVRDPIFISMIFVAALTVRDALGVRRAAGMQARVLNQISQDLNEKLGMDYQPVKEINGHKTAEVTVGILLGFFLATAFCNL